MNKIDVIALGEILIDFTSVGVSEVGQPIYEANPGGAPANVAAAIAKLGGRSAFIGTTGNDSFGSLLQKTLSNCGVITSGMTVSKNTHTTLAFVTLSDEGERSFSFCRNPGADTQLAITDLDMELLQNTKILHVGSLSLTHEPSRSSTLKAIEVVKAMGGYISYDPNWRSSLWQDEETGTKAMKSLLPYADIVKISESELSLFMNTVYQSDTIQEEALISGAEWITSFGPRLVLITLGSKGVFYYRVTSSGKKEKGLISVPKVSVVDTTGAGDSFTGGILFKLTRLDTKEDIFSYDLQRFTQDLHYAQGVASLCITKRGAIPALPDAKSVENFLQTSSFAD